MAASDIGFYILCSLRSSRPEVFCRKSVLRNFAKFTGKHLCQSFLFIKKETMEQLFSCEFCEISKRKDTLWNFSFRAFHEIQFQGYYMKHEILSWNTFTLVFQFHCVGFLSIKKLCLQLILLKFAVYWPVALLKKDSISGFFSGNFQKLTLNAREEPQMSLFKVQSLFRTVML